MPPQFLCRKLSWQEEPFWMKEEATLSATAPVSKRDRGAAAPNASEGWRVRSRGRAGGWRSIRIKMVRHHLGYAAQMPSKLTLAGGKKKGWTPAPAAVHPPFPSFLSSSIPQCTCHVREKQEKEERGNPI